MPSLIELRADYPLILTLLDPSYFCVLTCSYIARLPSAYQVPQPPIRPDHLVSVWFYIRLRSNFGSSACAPSACESAWQLTPAHASLREFRSHVDEQLTSPVECRCATPHCSDDFDFRESAVSLLAKAAEMCGCRTHMRLPGCHRRNPQNGSCFGCVGTRWCACPRTVWAS